VTRARREDEKGRVVVSTFIMMVISRAFQAPRFGSTKMRRSGCARLDIGRGDSRAERRLNENERPGKGRRQKQSEKSLVGR
jgi:hypothetical protein